MQVSQNGVFTATVELLEGDNAVVGTSADSGNNQTTVTKTVALDTKPPTLEILEPNNNYVTPNPTVQITGQTEPKAAVRINGNYVEVYPDGSFSAWILLQSYGANDVIVSAIDRAGNIEATELTVNRISHIYLPISVQYNPTQ